MQLALGVSSLVTADITETPTSAATTTDTGTTASDAASQNADAAASNTQDDADSAVNAFLDASKEGASGSDKGADDGTGNIEEDPLFVEAVEAKAAAIAQKKDADRAAQQAIDDRRREAAEADRAAKAQHEAGYKARIAKAQALRTALQEIEPDPTTGRISAADAERVAKEVENDFNSHHADGLKLYESDARKAADANATKMINDTLREHLGADADKFYTPDKSYDLAGMWDKVREIHREGYVREADAEAEKKTALLEYHRGLVKKDLIKGTTTGQKVGGTGAAGSSTPQNMRDVRLMHVGQHPSGQRLTTAEMRDYEARNSRGEFPG